MRMPTSARARVPKLCMLALASSLLAACAGEATAPAARVAPSSPFVVTDASKALVGVTDGVYTVNIDPRKDQTLSTNQNSLVIPAKSICKMDGSSGYGPEFWNAPCSPETKRVTITVTIRNASSSHPSIEFSPALRFDPAKNVQLSIFAQNASLSDASNLAMLYCNDEGACIDESLTDPDLQTYFDQASNQVFRRIKHFSGYVVWSLTEETTDSSLGGTLP
jgi:hypothetical protein